MIQRTNLRPGGHTCQGLSYDLQDHYIGSRLDQVGSFGLIDHSLAKRRVRVPATPEGLARRRSNRSNPFADLASGRDAPQGLRHPNDPSAIRLDRALSARIGLGTGPDRAFLDLQTLSPHGL
jgi:hypothetical protein